MHTRYAHWCQQAARTNERRLGDLKKSRNISPEAASLVGKIRNSCLRGDNQAANDARRDLRATLLGEHIQREIAKLPPLTDAQRDRLAAMLRGAAV